VYEVSAQSPQKPLEEPAGSIMGAQQPRESAAVQGPPGQLVANKSGGFPDIEADTPASLYGSPGCPLVPFTKSPS
jgi:hypothetical protein